MENSAEMNHPLVSVIVPVYNRGEAIGKCIKSLLAQEYPKKKLEIIIVDNNSTDNTSETIKKYPVKYLFEKEQGPSSARNKGIEHAKGEIIAFTDSDCIADKQWLRYLVEGFENKNTGGVGGRIIAHKPKTLAERYLEENNVLMQQTSIRGTIATANAAYRQDVLEKIGNFDTNLKSGEDADVAIRVQLEGYALNFAPKAIIQHKHRATLGALVKQQYWHAEGYAGWSKKYPNEFPISEAVISEAVWILYKLVCSPWVIARAVFKGETGEKRAMLHLIKIIALSAYLSGLSIHSFKRYKGKRVYAELGATPAIRLNKLKEKLFG